MRPSLSLLMLLLTGCSVVGNNTQTACSNNTACPQTCETASCEPRGNNGCSNWLCSSGCCVHGRHSRYKATPDNIYTRSEARLKAQCELHKERRGHCLTCDYRLGYEQAFVDVSLGGCGDVPALPPANYWKNCARSPEGHQKAQQWFSGYAAGAVRAKAIYEPYNKVAHSQFDCPGWTEAPPMNGNPVGY